MSAKTANPVETHTPHVTADTLVADHRALVFRRLLIIAVLIFCALVAFIVSTVVGPVNISVGDVIVGIFRPETLDRQSHTVIWKLRLPMSVMALLVGMALSVAGAQMQTILGNPLAEPFTLGISAAAAFGGASSIVFGLIFLPNAQLNIALIAWFAAMTASLVIVLASLFRGASAETMILLGIGLVFLFQAFNTRHQPRRYSRLSFGFSGPSPVQPGLETASLQSCWSAVFPSSWGYPGSSRH